MKNKTLLSWYFTKNKRLVKLYHLLMRFRANKENDGHFINKELGLIFIHNPKVAGNSIKEMLQLNMRSSTHQTPTFLVDRKTWEKYKSIVFVRDPIDRLISSYTYHTSKNYQGEQFRNYPSLKNWTLAEYFVFFSKQPFVIQCQVDYTQHLLSAKEVDFILKFEHMQGGLLKLNSELGVAFPKVEHLNKSKRSNETLDELMKNKELLKAVVQFYKKDYDAFGYKMPKIV